MKWFRNYYNLVVIMKKIIIEDIKELKKSKNESKEEKEERKRSQKKI